MFLRYVRNRKGKKYLMIVENYWKGGKTRQRSLFTLGALDQLLATGELENITRALSRFCERLRLVDLAKDVSVDQTYVFGSVYLVWKLFQRTPIREVLEDLGKEHEKLEIDIVGTMFAMMVSRFVHPCSKLSLKERWLDRLYPELYPLEVPLHHFYRTLDFLAKHTEEIQKRLLYPQRQRSLFDVPKLDLVFYDTTTLRFESIRNEEGSLRRFGYSKERRNDCTQVILGLLLSHDGMPVGYRLFPGNTYEGKTLSVILRKLKEELFIKRLIFVADRGMVQGKNVEEIEQAGFEFIMGMKLWAMPKVDQKRFEEMCRWDSVSEDFRIVELSHPKGRLIITWSRERAERDRQVREDLLKKLQQKLSRTDRSSSLISHKGFKRYLKVVEEGKLAIDSVAIAQEAKRDGLFGILTNVPQEQLSAQDILRRYKELWRIEDAFGEMKGTLQTRPMFHWTDRRIQGHVALCFLAYYLEAFVTKHLREAQADFTAPAALDALNDVRAVPIHVRGNTVWVRTQIDGIAAKTLQILKIQIPSNVLKLPPTLKPGETLFPEKTNTSILSNT